MEQPHGVAGIKNFVQMIGNARFRSSFINTIVYCLATVPFTLACALGLAVILNQKVKGRNFFRTVSFFPYVASLVAVAAVWNMLFSPQKSGPINMILYQLGVSAKSLPKWAADPPLGHVHHRTVFRMEEHGLLHGHLFSWFTGNSTPSFMKRPA